MAKITYASLKLKPLEEEVELKERNIMVKKYVSVNDIDDLIEIVLEKSYNGEIYSPVKMDMYFHLGIIYLYTNISFTEKQREDEAKLYDALLSNGIISDVLSAIPQDEYDRLCDYLETAKKDNLKYKNTTAGIIRNIVNDLPLMMHDVVSEIKDLNIDKYQDFLKQIKNPEALKAIAQMQMQGQK